MWCRNEKSPSRAYSGEAPTRDKAGLIILPKLWDRLSAPDWKTLKANQFLSPVQVQRVTTFSGPSPLFPHLGSVSLCSSVDLIQKRFKFRAQRAERGRILTGNIVPEVFPASTLLAGGVYRTLPSVQIRGQRGASVPGLSRALNLARTATDRKIELRAGFYTRTRGATSSPSSFGTPQKASWLWVSRPRHPARRPRCLVRSMAMHHLSIELGNVALARIRTLTNAARRHANLLHHEDKFFALF